MMKILLRRQKSRWMMFEKIKKQVIVNLEFSFATFDFGGY